MTKKASQWWLDGDLNEISVDGCGWHPINDADRELIARSNKSFEHAEYRLDNNQNEYDRIDAVLALKRAMDTRLGHLDSIYGFSQYPTARSHGWLALLESWGFIKQRTLRRLRRLRNSVEHDGAQPPTLDECDDYREVMWWFLKGTSGLLTPIIDFEFRSNHGPERGSCTFSYNPLGIELIASFLPERLSDTPLPNWIELETLPAIARAHQNAQTPVEVPAEGTYYVCAMLRGSPSVDPFLKIAMEQIS
ncbi:hypothetical protein [Embleya sp. MST-111070]|uniref:hypothetical protein n=1 Tax=Embleya sp. MST-111070 TaxID=3398231 RepID=UPI003F731A99